MTRRLKIYHDYRVRVPRPAVLHIPSAFLEAAGLDGAAEVRVEATHGRIGITGEVSNSPPARDLRRVDHDRIESTVEEICERMAAWPHRDLVRLAVMCGAEMKLK